MPRPRTKDIELDVEFDHFLTLRELEDLIEKDPERARKYTIWRKQKRREYNREYYQKNIEKCRENKRKSSQKRQELDNTTILEIIPMDKSKMGIQT